MASNFTIGQRVRVVRVGAWNGVEPNVVLRLLQGWHGEVKEVNSDTLGVEMVNDYCKTLGVLQFLPDELEVLDESSGGRVE